MKVLALACLALYGAGLTSTLSPCVLPLVPGYLGVLSGADGRSSRWPGLLMFSVGAGATFVALGGVASAAGAGLSPVVQWSQRVAGVGLVALGALMVLGRRGLVGGELRLVRHLPAGPHGRALLLGVGCGAAWSPCVGPLLGVALTAAGGTGSVGRGSLLLAWFALGVLTPFLALGVLPAGRPPRWLAVAGRRLSSAAWLLTVAIGAALALGWYDIAVGRLRG